MNISKRLFLTFVFILLSARMFCADAGLAGTLSNEASSTLMGDIDLSKIPHAWLSVLGGSSLTRPVKTSYGWANLTDGSMITSFTEDGTILWKGSLPSATLNFISADNDDFLAVPLRNKKLCFINPRGKVLWTKEIGFEAKCAPFFGRDGRMFVFGKDSIACFGANGIRKWSISCEVLDASLPAAEFSDGTLVVFLDAEEDGKTVGLRISPFGEQIERIVFASRVVNSLSVPEGVLLAFADGSLGLCAIDEESGDSFSKWTFTGINLAEGVKFARLDSDMLYAVVSPSPKGLQVHIINTQAAKLLRSFTVPEIKKASYVTATPSGIFMADAPTAAIYTSTGRRVRAIKFPLNKNKTVYDYVLYGDGGNIVFTSSSWTVTGWKILHGVSQKKTTKKLSANYDALYASTNSDYKRMYDAPKKSRQKTLREGGYASSEKSFWKDAKFVMDEYLSIKNTRHNGIARIPEDQGAYFALGEQIAVISTLGLFGTKDAADYLSRVLISETDESVLVPALKAIQACPYDPDGVVMDALASLIRKTPARKEALLCEVCDTACALCDFMCKKSFFEKAIGILSNLSMPQHGKMTKEKSRKAYKKLAEINK